MKKLNCNVASRFFGFILFSSLIISCENTNRIPPEYAYAAGWRDGFIKGLQRQDWTPTEFKEQAMKDSLVFFNVR
jgi:hypothetical protein